MPFSFALHPWFVCINNGQASRWEIAYQKNSGPISWGYLHKDILPAASGIQIMHFTKKYMWPCRQAFSIAGGEGSLAQKVLNFIAASPGTYPYKDKYFLAGPNSNTYIQWVLDNFPGINYKLPWNAVGKGYEHTPSLTLGVSVGLAKPAVSIVVV